MNRFLLGVAFLLPKAAYEIARAFRRGKRLRNARCLNCGRVYGQLEDIGDFACPHCGATRFEIWR